MNTSVLGFGTVGKGVVEMIDAAEGMNCVSVLVRPGKDDRPYKVSDIQRITADLTVDTVAEVLGGIHPACEYADACIHAGKNVVTSNKALVAAHGIELTRLARQRGVGFLFSAACGGGVPILHDLSVAVESDRILSVGGILNGTTNYMLDAMQRRGLTYEEALRDAQELGYAEKDPSADVSGLDALRKIMLACGVAFDILPNEGLHNEGIESVKREDVDDFKARGLCLRLLARGGRNPDGSIYAYVEPVLLPLSAPECAVLNNYNMAKYEGECSGPIVLMGQGAGRYPTASAVLRDITCIDMGRKYMFSPSCREGRAENGSCLHRYYVRVPESLSGHFDIEDMQCCDGIARMITKPMSVELMHTLARELREDGSELFFAGLEE